MDLHEKSLVAQTIAAFSAASVVADKKRPTKAQSGAKHQSSEADSLDDSVSTEVLEARVNRDVVSEPLRFGEVQVGEDQVGAEVAIHISLHCKPV